MEVVLLTDVKELGHKYEVIRVKSGYGRNYLLPEGLAVLATDKLKKELEVHAEDEAKKREAQAEQSKQIAQKLKNITLTIKRKVTSTGKLYGALTEQVLADTLKAEHDIEVAVDTIKLDDHIKKVGDYRVEVVLSEDTTGHFKVVVKEEK